VAENPGRGPTWNHYFIILQVIGPSQMADMSSLRRNLMKETVMEYLDQIIMKIPDSVKFDDQGDGVWNILADCEGVVYTIPLKVTHDAYSITITYVETKAINKFSIHKEQ
jgi:hypothetical protein